MSVHPRWWRIAAVVWAAAIFASGVVPTRRAVAAVSGGHDTATTTIAHFLAYAVLGYLAGMALGGRRADARTLLTVVALAAALGAAVELVQGPLPYRDAQLVDFVVDAIGAAAGCVVLSVAARVRRA